MCREFLGVEEDVAVFDIRLLEDVVHVHHDAGDIKPNQVLYETARRMNESGNLLGVVANERVDEVRVFVATNVQRGQVEDRRT